MSAHIDKWNEIRTAYLVARHGTLSAAARELGVHHATVQRQIAALEERLHTRLFYRNARGYAPTEAGKELLKAGAAAEEQFDLLAARIGSLDQRLSGRLVVTTIPECGGVLVPLLAEYQRRHPDLTLELIADPRRLKLEHGEAHVSLRAGPPPAEPDNVAQNLTEAAATLWASRDYIERHGPLQALNDTGGHRFVSAPRDAQVSPLTAWVEANVADEAIVFRAGDVATMMTAMENGMGIGPMLCWPALANQALLPLCPPPPDWHGTLWLVSHVDQHRTAKVQSFLHYLKRAVSAQRHIITGDTVRRDFEQ